MPLAQHQAMLDSELVEKWPEAPITYLTRFRYTLRIYEIAAHLGKSYDSATYDSANI
jgi:hypothetical protein